MATFSEFDRSNLRNLRGEMQALLEKYGVESNLEINIGNMKFSQHEVEIKVSAKVKGMKSISNNILDRQIETHGLTAINAFGEELVDYNLRAHKMPFVYRSPNGKLYKCDTRTAKMRFAKQQ